MFKMRKYIRKCQQIRKYRKMVSELEDTAIENTQNDIQRRG